MLVRSRIRPLLDGQLPDSSARCSPNRSGCGSPVASSQRCVCAPSQRAPRRGRTDFAGLGLTPCRRARSSKQCAEPWPGRGRLQQAVSGSRAGTTPQIRDLVARRRRAGTTQPGGGHVARRRSSHQRRVHSSRAKARSSHSRPTNGALSSTSKTCKPTVSRPAAHQQLGLACARRARLSASSTQRGRSARIGRCCACDTSGMCAPCGPGLAASINGCQKISSL